MPGLHVGRIDWSLLYVALSRTRELQDIKFFPCSWSGFSNFKHLTRLKPSSIFVKWNSGYRDHVWCPEILEAQNRRNQKYVENKLVRQGPGVSLKKTKDILIGYLKGFGYKVLKKTNRDVLQKGIMHHMERQNLWKLGEDKAKFLSKRGIRKRKKSQVNKRVPRKSRKLSDGKKPESLNLAKKSGSVKAKQKLPKKKHPAHKKKSKKQEDEEMLPERYLFAEELQFDKFIFERKGYRINPIERDGNCLFRAVADQVYCDLNLHAHIRNLCANYMQEEEKYFSEFYNGSLDYTNYVSQLRKDGTWAGYWELVALTHIYKRSIEVYANSEEPTMVESSNNEGNNGPPIRLFYRNNHYASIRSDGAGDLFNFEELKPGELEEQIVKLNDPSIIKKSKEYQKRIQAEKNLDELDSRTRQAIEESIAVEETEKAYMRFYASRLKKKPNQQIY